MLAALKRSKPRVIDMTRASLAWVRFWATSYYKIPQRLEGARAVALITLNFGRALANFQSDISISASSLIGSRLCDIRISNPRLWIAKAPLSRPHVQTIGCLFYVWENLWGYALTTPYDAIMICLSISHRLLGSIKKWRQLIQNVSEHIAL